MFTDLSRLSLSLFRDSELIVILLESAVIITVCALLPRFFPNHGNTTEQKENDMPHLTFLRRSVRPIHPSVKEWSLLLMITLLYTAVSFHKLGGTVMPHTTWQPVSVPQETVLELYENTSFQRIMILAGEGDNNARTDGYQFGLQGLTIEISDDGETWAEITVLDERRYCQYIDIYGDWNGRYIRLTSTADTDALTEIAFADTVSQSLLPVRVVSDTAAESAYPASLMIDEQDAVIIDNTYLNESYFDEVYHPRNAWEIAEGQYMYSTVHPLLGTNLIALSIKLFGMNPLAWRLPGALIGVLLIPVFWYLLRLLTDRPEPALLGAALLGADFMHITTSRIATLEPMSVFFILLMFVFIVRWCRTSFFDRPLSASLKELFFCGIMTGLGISVKWTACFSAVGLAVIYFTSMFMRAQEYQKLMAIPAEETAAFTRAEKRVLKRAKNFPDKVRKTILWSFLFFIGIPLVIYFLAYLPCGISRDGWSVKAVCDQISYMYNYHVSLDATHPYQSTWTQWLIDARPVWYYCKTDLSGVYHTIACFTNPVLSAAGLVSILYVFYDAIKTREPAPYIIAVGYISALAPWVTVDRCVFAYHFYPTSFFMIASTVWMFYRLVRQRPQFKAVPLIILALAVIVFLIYLPVLTGFGTSQEFVHSLEIIPSWYFG